MHSGRYVYLYLISLCAEQLKNRVQFPTSLTLTILTLCQLISIRIVWMLPLEMVDD
jgi:hypothetical protein